MIRGPGRAHLQILVWSSIGKFGKKVNVGGGPSRVIVPADIIDINVPDSPRTINLEMSAVDSKVAALVRGGGRFGFATEELELDICKKGGGESTKKANKPSDSDL